MYQHNINETCYTVAFFKTLCATPDIHPNTKKAMGNAICENNCEVFNAEQLNRIALNTITEQNDCVAAHYYATHSDFFENIYTEYVHLSYLVTSVPVMKTIHDAGTSLLSATQRNASLLLSAVLVADNVNTLKALCDFDNRWLTQHHNEIYRMANTHAPTECLKWLTRKGLSFRNLETCFFRINSNARTLNSALFLLEHGTPFVGQRDAIVEAALRGERLDVAMAFLHAGATLDSTPETFIQAFFGSPTKALKALKDDAPATLIISLIERRIRRSSETLYTLMKKSPAHLKPYFMDVISKRMQ